MVRGPRTTHLNFAENPALRQANFVGVHTSRRGVHPVIQAALRPVSPSYSVRPEGAYHQWRKVPSRELSIDLVADERLGWVTDWVEAS